MLGRRTNERFRFAQPANGAVRVYCDVIVTWNGSDEWIAISREAAVAGELLSLEVDDGEHWHQYPVCVIESRPIVVDGDMRHRIRLQSSERPPIFFEQQVRRG